MPTLTARCPADVLAMVPVVLGFEPGDSVVMLAIDAGEAFHARVDLPPPDQAAVDELVGLLLDPVGRHGVRSVVLVLYTADDDLARAVVARLRQGTPGRPGPRVIDALRAHAGRWFPLLTDPPGDPGTPYDVSSHRFVVEAVVSGRVLHGSREALAATLRPDPDAVAAVEAALPGPSGTAQDALGCLARWVDDERPPPPEAVAGLLTAVAEPEVRVVVWSTVPRSRAGQHARFWTGVLRRSPPALAAHAASVLALFAWLSGDGALAWCAVDRAGESDPDHPLAALVADLLTGAVPPSAWEPALRATMASPGDES